jgi:NTP pyrophosphatase (non-canonical NTP hydrolase)
MMNPMISQDDIDAFSESPPSKLSENQKHYLDKKMEVLVILMEECSEVAQEASKLIRFPENDTEKLAKELGDLQCMINLTANHLGIDPIQIGVQVNNKRDKLHKYSNLFSK